VTRKEQIERKLEALAPVALIIDDESHRHKGGVESHYNVAIVTAAFESMSRVERHRRVHALLADEFAGGLHALTLTLRTPAEDAAAGGQAIASPSCHGGTGR
jgi:BolA protein